MGIKILKKNKINENNKNKVFFFLWVCPKSLFYHTILSGPVAFKTFKTASVYVQLRSVSFEYWKFSLGFKIEIIDSQERSSAILVLRHSRIIDKKKVKAQGHPATVFCEISVRGSKYSLKFYITWRRLKISRWPFQSGTIFDAYLINSLRFSEVWFFHISLPRFAYFS